MKRIVLPAVMLVLAAVVGLPLYYIVVNTFKTMADMTASPLGLPDQWYFGNYAEVFERTPVLQSFANTLYVTLGSVFVQLAVGAMAGYGIIMRASRLNRAFGVLLLVAFVVPSQATLIPLYRTLVQVDLVDSLNGLIVMYAGGAIFSFFLIHGYMKTLPFEIVEAARIDGAGAWQIFWRIVLPLIKPILITVGVFQTMWVWNDFILPTVFISSAEKRTLVLQVYSAVGEFTTDWPAFMTLTVIVLLPMVLFFVLTQRHIVSGLLSGGVKG